MTNLGVRKQQLIEIAKALSKEVKLLILDEPTASLNESDSDALLELLLELKEQGISSILISHKLNEISKVADSITVLRDGATIDTFDCRQEAISEDRIIQNMVGREMADRYPKRTPEIGETIFEVRKWRVHHPIHPDRVVIKDVDFHVRKGEIVGISGLMGAGRTELAKSIFGRTYGTRISGEVSLHGKKVDLSTIQKAIAHGIAYVTEDRKGDGLVLDEDIKKNISLANLGAISDNMMIDEAREFNVADDFRAEMRIRCSSVMPRVVNLSGGNQQKVVLSKWLFSNPEVLILDEPTRGIDVGAKYEIYSLISQLASEGKCIIMISSEMPELLGMCDRIYVMSEQVKAGTISIHDFMAAEAGMSRSAGTCNTMGTASTMACMAEALGTSLPHNAAIPAVDARRYVLAHMSGMRIVDMVWEDLRLSKILTRAAFENAIRVNAAIGGSTNAVIHLKAIAGRIGVDLELEDWTRVGRGTPTIVDLQPSGRFLMEEFYYAGGLPAVLRRLGETDLLPHKDALTVNGKRLWENTHDTPIYNDEVVRPLEQPLIKDGGICILRGNLSLRGAVLKPSAATPALMQHRGKAVVFEDFEHYKARINDPDLDVDASSVLVMKNCGPKGYPGMAEVGNMGLPPKLLAQGVKDMVRISDARMSGTAYGTVVLHVAPEAAAGGPLGIVQDGDWIELDCAGGRLHLDISDDEMAQRQAQRAACSKTRRAQT